MSSVCAGAAVAAAVHTLLEADRDAFLLGLGLELQPGHTADAGAPVVCLALLYTLQAAQLLVAALPPLRNQPPVGYLLLQQPLVKLPRDRTPLVVHGIHIPRPLAVDLHYPPQIFLALALA